MVHKNVETNALCAPSGDVTVAKRYIASPNIGQRSTIILAAERAASSASPCRVHVLILHHGQRGTVYTRNIPIKPFYSANAVRGGD